ncbi:hypothetical protein L9G15_23390, partial [Shewanella sp. A3A]|nr:hypothetical protein [Shewanella ferrihydritica]
ITPSATGRESPPTTTTTMALASTSATASAAVLKTPFLGAKRALANAVGVAGAKPAPRRAAFFNFNGGLKR